MALLVAAGSVALADSASTLVPDSGHIQWRFGGGYGPGFGGVAFDRLADLRQQIIRRSNAVLFRATVGEGSPPPGEIYWRMESLDFFDGVAWRSTVSDPSYYSPGRAGGDPAYAYSGTTATITSRVQIDKLRSPVVPSPGVATFIQSDSVNVGGFQVAGDGSVFYQAQLDEGDQYQMQSSFPLLAQDLGALASLPDGTLSPLFANAAADGEFTATPTTPPPDGESRPPDLDAKYVRLPEDLPNDIGDLAREVTSGASTDFEAAWLLQYWFRDSGEFHYSTNVSTGHGSLELADWLTVPGSVNYRTGYCEQFAASMAVLGRALGIPSRVVWGFTPGSVQDQADGSQVIVVRDRNAHAWVEMWMDGFGWVRFDPTPRGDGALPESVTAGFDPVEYLPPPSEVAPVLGNPGGFLEDETPVLQPDTSDLGVSDGSGSQIPSWWLIVPALLLLALAVPVTKIIRRRRRLRRLREGDITAAWDEIVDRLVDLGEPVAPHQTPLEFAAASDRSLVPLATRYSAAVYGGRNGTATEMDLDLAEGWLRLHYDSGRRARASFNPRSLMGRD